VRRELREGKLLLLAEYVDEGAEAVAYARHTEVPNQEALIVVNRGTKPLQQRLMIPHTPFYPTLHLKDLLAPDDATPRIEFRSLVPHVAIVVPVISRQVWNRCVISWRHMRARRRWRLGRKCDAIGP